MKKKIAFFLVILIFLGSLSAYAANNYYDGISSTAPTSWTDAQWAQYKVSQGIDPSLPIRIIVKGSTVYFNRELWEEKHVPAYGNYSLVTRNDFKPLTSGYYIRNGVAGECRFEGYDRDAVRLR